VFNLYCFPFCKVILLTFLCQALNKQEWTDGEPTEAEKDFWELASLDCYNHLSEWKSLEYCSTAGIDSKNPPDLSKMWSEPFYQVSRISFR
jgi:DNA-dependent protein kinase catalytic subunit